MIEVTDKSLYEQRLNDALSQYSKLKQASPAHQRYEELRKQNDWFYKAPSSCGSGLSC